MLINSHTALTLAHRCLLKSFGINISIWATANLPLAKPNINPNLLSIDCCWVKGRVGGRLPRYWYWSRFCFTDWTPNTCWTVKHICALPSVMDVRYLLRFYRILYIYNLHSIYNGNRTEWSLTDWVDEREEGVRLVNQNYDKIWVW